MTDSEGNESSDTVRVTVTPNSAPTALIESPADELLYLGGSQVTLNGSGSGLEDGELTGDSLRWQVLLHHNTHVHALTAQSGAETSFTPLVDHDADSFCEVRLTVTDSGGRSSAHTIELRPETSDLELASSPPGAPLSYDSAQAEAPFSRTAAVGYEAQITAPETFERGGRTYRFDSWSDAGARSHAVSVPEGSPQFVARYEAEDVDTLVFEPVADAHVDSLDRDSSYGQRPYFEVDADPTQRQAFVKFDVSGLDRREVVGARLSLRQLDHARGLDLRRLRARGGFERVDGGRHVEHKAGARGEAGLVRARRVPATVRGQPRPVGGDRGRPDVTGDGEP